MEDYAVAQKEKRWAKEIEDFSQVDNADLRIGILGLGMYHVVWHTPLASISFSCIKDPRAEATNTVAEQDNSLEQPTI